MLLTLDRPLDTPPRKPRTDCVDRAREVSAVLFEAGPRIDAAGHLEEDVFDALRRSRLPQAAFPSALGGDDLLAPERATALARVLRLVGAGDLSVARIFEGHVNAVALVSRYGTAGQLADFAACVENGDLSGVWNAEGRAGLTAKRSSDGWTLAGAKILASGAGHVRLPIVTPRAEDGVLMLMPRLMAEAPIDLSGWLPQGMRASATGTVSFDGMHVPLSAQIGGVDAYQSQPSFSGGAWRFCAVHLGAAERLLDLFRADLVARGRGGDGYQKQRIALCTAAVTTAALWIDKAATLIAAEDGDPDTLVAFVNMTRMVTERACLDVLEAVHRGMGLGAFIKPNPVERISRDLSTYLRQPVPDAAMADAATFILASAAPSAEIWDV